MDEKLPNIIIITFSSTPSDFQETTIKNKLRQFGTIQKIELQLSPKARALVVFAQGSAARLAMQNLNGSAKFLGVLFDISSYSENDFKLSHPETHATKNYPHPFYSQNHPYSNQTQNNPRFTQNDPRSHQQDLRITQNNSTHLKNNQQPMPDPQPSNSDLSKAAPTKPQEKMPAGNLTAKIEKTKVTEKETEKVPILVCDLKRKSEELLLKKLKLELSQWIDIKILEIKFIEETANWKPKSVKFFHSFFRFFFFQFQFYLILSKDPPIKEEAAIQVSLQSELDIDLSQLGSFRKKDFVSILDIKSKKKTKPQMASQKVTS